jgi:hypothetical protein
LELRDLVRRYHVTWESQPELAVENGETLPIGFIVDIGNVLTMDPRRGESLELTATIEILHGDLDQRDGRPNALAVLWLVLCEVPGRGPRMTTHAEVSRPRSHLLSRLGAACILLAAGYLVVLHWQHVAPVLPVLALLACPLTHLLHHGGHDHQ